ncbi:Myosin-17 [Thalictrum thalictroides]|uniref:Myosin-17 n=1 Tax=Thalictrum thalictroides TaxID=46969 RepID=A0A7J6VXN1_THATH|nr:Myosin-17 [Thalictrum thalictroides]
MIDVVLMLEKRIPVGKPPYPFQFRQSSNSSMPPSVLETVPEIYSKDHERVEEKVSNIESENPVFRQHSEALSPSGKVLASQPTPTIFENITEKEQNGESRDILDINPAVLSLEPLSEERPQKSLNEKQQEYQDLLIKCISQDLGFSVGRPVTACLIYKCLLHWRSFELERTSLFDRIIEVIDSAIKVHENNDSLSYWLSNTSTLVLLLQRTLKANDELGLNPQRRRSASASLFRRMTQGLRGPQQNAGISFLNSQGLAGVDDLRYVEARYPALLFKQQLAAFLEKIYGLIRDNLKKEVSITVALCIQAARTSRASRVKGSGSQQYLLAHWESIVKILNNYLKALRENYVPPFLVSKLFTQIFSFVNVQLFNSVLLRRECCSFSNGEFIKNGLAELEHWCVNATEKYAGSAWHELKHIRQTVGFLVIHQKPKTLKEITNDLCPVLSLQQIYRISTMYHDDKYNTHSVSSDVISSLRILMTEDSNNAVSSSFLLDDDSSIPFSIDDISKSTQEIDISDIDPPPFLCKYSGFHFLLQPVE